MRMDLETLSPEICGRIGEMQKVLEEMMQEVREYSYELNPSTVERAGLGRRWTASSRAFASVSRARCG